MKKLFSIFAILMVTLSAMAAIEPVQPEVGDGSTDKPYKIGTPGNLVWFANEVNRGQTSICAELTTDIDLGDDQTMIGTETNKFSGTFDGGNNTITVHYVNTNTYVALFKYVKAPATIKNLKTAGKIENCARFAAGIVAYCEDSSGKKVEITNCQSSVEFENLQQYSSLRQGNYGGIVGHSISSLDIINCVFNGKFNCPKVYECSGITALANGNTVLKGCLFSPTEVIIGNKYTSDNAPFFIGDKSKLTLTNCVATTDMGVEQGELVSAEGLQTGEVCYKLNGGVTGGTQDWYQTIGTDNVPVLDKTHGKVYGGVDNCSYTNEPKAHGTTITTDGIEQCSVCGQIYSYAQGEYDESTNTYTIANKGNLIAFAQKVNGGNNTINAKVTADIDLGDDQTMIGTDEHPYSGTFDGGGNSITFHYVGKGNYVSLFKRVRDSHIKNLKTAGSITSEYQYAAGIVAYSDSTTNITNCQSSVAITFTYAATKDATYGGIVANNQNKVNLKDVLFDGKLLGSTARNCGGLIGWSEVGANITGCLFSPSESTFSSTNASTLSRGNNVKVTSSFYTKTLGTAQGDLASSDMLKSGEVCHGLNQGIVDGKQAWYQTIDTDVSPVLDKTHVTVYGGISNCPCTTYTNTPVAHQLSVVDGYNVCKNCTYSELVPAEYDEATETYLISSKGNLVWFANKVNSGETNIKGKLLSDVDLGTDQTAIGTEENHFAGSFDGNGHSITVHYVADSETDSNDETVSLFYYIEGATISNLITKGTIKTRAKYAGGIVGGSYGICHINNCQSSVEITSTKTSYENAFHGGIVGHAYKGERLYLTNVLFNGKILGEKATCCGGLVGYTYDNPVNVTNCLANPTSLTCSSAGYAALVETDQTNKVSISNSYYTLNLGKSQGKEISKEAVENGEACYLLNSKVTEGNQGWYQTLGTDACPVPFNTHDTVYYTGTDYCPVDSYTNNFVGHEIVEEDGCKYCNNCTLAVVFEPATYDEETSTYSINNKGNFCWFTDNFNNGDISANAKVKLTVDINLGNEQRMIGTSTKEFAGTFDGDGHMLTVNYEAKEKYTAPFHYVNGATIQNLRVAGDISTDVEKAAGIVGASSGNTNITNCQSSVTINWTKESSQNTFPNIAGVVAEGLSSGTLNISNVLFDGKMLGYYNTCQCYGMVGNSEHAVKLTNCLFSPEQLTVSKEYVYSYTLTCASNATITNCYYTTALGTVQGTLASATDAISGKLCAALNDSIADGSQAWYQNLSSGSATADAYPVPFNTHDTVYAGDEAHPKTLAYSNETHVYVENDNGFLIDELCDLYKVVSAEYNDEAGAYVLKNAGNLVWLSDHVSKNDGNINAVMENDIDMSGVDFTPIGAYPSDGNKPYNGTFNGQGHRIKNLVVNKTNDLVGLFGCVSGNTTIKNLIIDKTCSFTRTSGYGAAGIVGCLARTSDESDDAISLTLDACGNEANVTGDINAAGLVGGVYNTDTYGNATVNITNCYNTGNIKGSGASNGESAAFIAYGNSNTTVKNCYNTGTVVGNWTGLSLVRVKNGSTVVLRNIYNLESVAAQSSDDCKTVTAFQVRIGDLCNKLRSGENATVWAQNLETDAQPVFGTAGLHYARAMANYQWGTVCLPFAIKSDDKVQLFAMTSVTTDVNGVMTFTPVETVSAYTPCVFKKKNAEADSVMFTATGPIEAIEFTLTTNPIEGWTMTGTFEELTGKTGIYYISDDQFWYADADTKVPAFRAWFETTSSNPAKSLSIKIADGDQTTTIGEISADGKVTFNDTPIYNIAGQRLSAPHKGLNIIGNRKVYIK